MAPDQSDYKIQNAPLMTPRQESMLNSLLAGYATMMKGTTFGQAYPGPTRSAYTPKTFNPGAMSGIIPGKPGETGAGGGWKWKGGGGDGGDGGDGDGDTGTNKDKDKDKPKKTTPITQLLSGIYTQPPVNPLYSYKKSGRY
jgi:hypothetical protein